MLDQIWINIKVHFKFYRRSRLMLAFAMAFALIAGLALISLLSMNSVNQHFNVIQQIFSVLNYLSFVFTAGLALTIVSDHLKNRSVKMVLTKPCLPETWLASCFLSAIIVCFFFYLMILLLTLTLSVMLGVPFQSGFIFACAYEFLCAVIVLSYLIFLSTIMSPVMAGVVAYFLGEKIVFYLVLITSASPGFFNLLFNILYMALPIYHPFYAKVQAIYNPMRVGQGDWIYLVYTAGYMLAACLFFFLLTDYSLRRKNLA